VLSRKFVDTIPTSFRPSVQMHVRVRNPENPKKNLDSRLRGNDEKKRRLSKEFLGQHTRASDS
jgi:hypothetical protein